uniref:Cytochrome b-c1 complex subunit 9 n=1 Tax=Timema shepardi TaxID=629360 RepID=A0A7R9AWC9_TIMSH|nr:unnamed protein product [Timema shepardi]
MLLNTSRISFITPKTCAGLDTTSSVFSLNMQQIPSATALSFSGMWEMKMARISSIVYNALFKRTSTFAATIIVGAFFFERSFELGSNYIYDSINKGHWFTMITTTEHGTVRVTAPCTRHCQGNILLYTALSGSHPPVHGTVRLTAPLYTALSGGVQAQSYIIRKCCPLSQQIDITLQNCVDLKKQPSQYSKDLESKPNASVLEYASNPWWIPEDTMVLSSVTLEPISEFFSSQIFLKGIVAGDWKPCGLSSTKIIDEGFDLLDNGSLVLDVEDTSGEKTRNLVYPPSSFCSDSVYLVSCLPLRPSDYGGTSNRHLDNVMWRASHFQRNSMGRRRIRRYLLETSSRRGPVLQISVESRPRELRNGFHCKTHRIHTTDFINERSQVDIFPANIRNHSATLEITALSFHERLILLNLTSIGDGDGGISDESSSSFIMLCPCEESLCVRKCCSPEKILSFSSNQTKCIEHHQNNSEEWKPDFGEGSSNLTYVTVYGSNICKPDQGIYVLNPNSEEPHKEFYILENGQAVSKLVLVLKASPYLAPFGKEL